MPEEKGFLISTGYIGFLDEGKRQEFETEDAYLEYIRDSKE